MTGALHARVIAVVGGAGFLGLSFGQAILGAGARLVLVDIDGDALDKRVAALREGGFRDILAFSVDAIDEPGMTAVQHDIHAHWGPVDVLVNCAAVDARVGTRMDGFTRLENFPLDQWRADIDAGLTTALVSTKTFGPAMAARGRGQIVSISSDLGLISPDQRLYSCPDLPDGAQPVKPVSYTVVKTALVGFTRYIATYWANSGVRANALCLGGIRNEQPDEFIARIADRIPMGRLGRADEAAGVLVFLCSDASSYINGATLVVDGGRSAW